MGEDEKTEQRAKIVNSLATSEENSVDRPYQAIANSLEKAADELIGTAHELVGAAQNLKALDKNEIGLTKRIAKLEQDSHAAMEELRGVKEDISSRREEVKQYMGNTAENNIAGNIAEKEKNLQKLKERAAEIMSEIEKRNEEMGSLEQQLGELSESKFSEFYKNYIQALSSLPNQFKDKAQEGASIRELVDKGWSLPPKLEPPKYEQPVDIAKILGFNFEETPVDEAFRHTVSRLEQAVGGVFSSLRELYECYEAEHKIGEKINSLAKENENGHRLLHAGESAIASIQTQIEKLKGLAELIKTKKEIEARIKQYDEETTSAYEELRETGDKGNQLMEKLRNSELIKVVAHLLGDEAIKALVPEQERRLLPSADREEQQEPQNHYENDLRLINGLEKPYSDLYEGLEYGGKRVYLLNGLAFFEHMESVVKELNSLYEKLEFYKEVESYHEEDFSTLLVFLELRRQFDEKVATGLNGVLEDILHKYNFSLQQALSLRVEKREGPLRYEINEENMVLDCSLAQNISKIFKAHVYSSKEVPNGELNLKPYFPSVKTKITMNEESKKVLKGTEMLCEISRRIYSQKQSEYDASFAEQMDYLKQLLIGRRD